MTQTTISRLKQAQVDILSTEPIWEIDTESIENWYFNNNLNAKILLMARSLDISIANANSLEISQHQPYTFPTRSLRNILGKNLNRKTAYELQKLDLLYLEQLLNTKGTYMITWAQLKKIKGLSSKGRKALWFQSIEELLIDNKRERTLKEELIFKGNVNRAVLKPKLKEISEKRSKKEWVMANEATEARWEIGRVESKTEKTVTIQQWKVVEETPEKEAIIEKENSTTQEKTTKRYKKNALKDISNWVKYKPKGWSVGLTPEELQSNSHIQLFTRKESKLQEIRIKNNSWGEYLIDRALHCAEERKDQLKKLLKNNQNRKQIHIYTDGSLKEDQNSTKILGYALVQIDINNVIISKLKGRTDNWASSTRAELMAILEALLISPEKSEVNIFTDSMAGIQAVEKVKKNTMLKAREWLKKNNTAILKAINQAIETKLLRVVMHKVKAHSGISGNEIADLEAKKGLLEANIVKVQHIQTKAAAFSIFWRGIEIESPIRKFIKKLNNSRHKAEWVFIRGGNDSIHGNRESRMCWKVFKRLISKYRKKQGSSLEENSRWIFILKCINRMLPTLEKRNYFRPDLYTNSICPRCNKKEETFEHLLECVADKEKWTKVNTEVQAKLEEVFLAKDISRNLRKKVISILFPSEAENLSIRRQETSRGLIPKKVVEEISLLGISSKKTRAIVEAYTEAWIEKFRVLIWKNRCKEITQWEKIKGISNSDKRNKGRRKKRKKSTLSKANKQTRKEEVWLQAEKIAFDEIENWIHKGQFSPWIMY
jgi:ribonuclease HI